MTIAAGRLTRRVTIQQLAGEAQNSFGEEVGAWTTLATVWAERMDTRAQEIFSSNRERAEKAAVFRMRYRSDVTHKMQLVEGGKTYDIESITEIGHREDLEVIGTEAAP